MNRALSILALLPFVTFAETGCSGSGGTTDVSPAIADPNVVVVNGSDAGTTDGRPVIAGPDVVVNSSDAGSPGNCSGAGCGSLSMIDLCRHPHTTLLKDGYPADDAANAIMQSALVANCLPPPMSAVLEKGAPGAIDPSTGRPLAGPNDLLTVAGGAFVQKTVAFLDLTGATPLYLVANDSAQSWQYLSRAPGGPIAAEMPYAAFSATHDLILIELVRDAVSGTPVLIAFGQEAESTTAAARYIANEMLPNRSRYDKSWYVYEWTEHDAGATYSLKASGP
jgi:hypothetical protein